MLVYPNRFILMALESIIPFQKFCKYHAAFRANSIDDIVFIANVLEVQYVDTEIIKSFSLFGFNRSDERKEFTIWTYNCFNVEPKEILELMLKQPKLESTTPKILQEIISKCK